MKVLLIDDEQIALDVLDIFLREIGGITVVGKYKRVSDALENMPALQPDLIMLDIEMPEQTGLSVVEQLKQCCPGVEIIFVTAHANYALEAYDREALAYILKPVNKQKLAKAIERAAVLITGKSAVRNNQLAETIEPLDDTSVRKLTLKTLGSLELYTAEGKLLTWRTKKTKELFAYLWHHQGKPVYKYAIMDELWQEYSAQQAQRLFHTTVYYLRSMFKTEGYPNMLSYGDDKYWLDMDVLSSDLQQLMDVTREQHIESRAADLQHILSVYSGDYFEKEHYEWSLPLRMSLHHDYVSQLLRIKKVLNSEDQILLLNKLIELESDSERYYDELIDRLEEQGDTVGAKQIQQLKRKLS